MRYKIYRVLFLILLIVPIITSCKDKKKSIAEKIVKEWMGKEIKFPSDARCTLMGQDTICSELFSKPYKVLVYIDSIGCTSCKFRLFEWEKIMREADSIAPLQIGFLFFFNPKSEKELIFMLKRDRINFPVFIDNKNEIQQLNRFPDNIMYQSFLLDQDDKVLLIGNPTMNPQVWELYKQHITGRQPEKAFPITEVNVEEREIVLAELQIRKSTKMEFVLRNTGQQALIVNDVKSSCGCTVPNWKKEPIQPGKEIKIYVEVKPEEIGYFHKTIDVYCNVKEQVIQLIVTGTVEK